MRRWDNLEQGYNVVVLSEAQSDVDWGKLKDDGVQAAIIRLSHGVTQDLQASANLSKAKQLGMYVHGYHAYEGIDNEVTFSLSNAEALGLPEGSYFFIQGAPDDEVIGFVNNWLSAGWSVGMNGLSDEYYQWIVSDSAPDKYDVWQMDDLRCLDNTGELVSEPKKNTPGVDNFNPGKPQAGAYVGFGNDTTGLLGGQTLGYSTNGNDFYAVITPFGMIFRDVDADRMSKLMINKLKLQSPNGTVFNLVVNDEGELKAEKESDR
ncbi:GH25 family lysozyme [Pediococcus acidilactici]|uniref:GH25 family lysozyme n=1 Tax=Pediococcus acidilactici TaxID=1254 RepID=UPI003B437196